MTMPHDQRLKSSPSSLEAVETDHLPQEDSLLEILLRPTNERAIPSEKDNQAAPAGTPPVLALPGVVIGRLAGHTDEGSPLVEYAALGSSQVLPARTIVAWGTADVGREVALQFEQGDERRPVIMGFLQTVRPQPLAPAALQTEVDGERLVLSADKEIVLRCGEASITLTRAGKVLIRGAYLLSRSSGVNRIKGGSVQIN